ncbi:unnamed protein product [Sphagnum jensenii]|uniref:Uncharacterized protein n=1 Tax=Sphagnum jensenii TaxID=128206 RepID=A0ABP1BWK4_9BRYO
MAKKRSKIATIEEATAAAPLARITRNAAARQLAPAHFTAQMEAALGKTMGCNSLLSRSGPELLKRRKKMEPTLVHNLLAIADTHGFKNRSHADDEQHIFLETIRAVSITPAVARVPPKEIYDAILNGIQESKSVELTVASFQLLHDLDLRHPQATLRTVKGKSDKDLEYEFIVTKDIWSPFDHTFQVSQPTGAPKGAPPRVPTDLYALLECIEEQLGYDEWCKTPQMKIVNSRKEQDPYLRLLQFLMLQWLASLLKSDAQIRAQAFQANPSNNFHLVQNSLIRRLLQGPYRGNTKNLLKFLLHIIARTSDEQEWESKTECKEEDMGDKVEDTNTGDKVEGDLLDNQSSDPLAATEIVIHTNPYIRDCDFSNLAHTVLFMVMELDTYKALDDQIERRSNGRSGKHFVDQLLSLLQYESHLLEPFLQVLENQQHKLKIIIEYFVTHAPKSMREKLMTISTAQELFGCIASATNSANVCKTFGSYELQLLLAHAFQAFLEIDAVQRLEKGQTESSSSKSIGCVQKMLLEAFGNLRHLMKDSGELCPAAAQALFVAKAITVS